MLALSQHRAQPIDRRVDRKLTRCVHERCSNLENTVGLLAITMSILVMCVRTRISATCARSPEMEPTCRNAVARDTPALFATASTCSVPMPYSAI